MRIGKEKGIKFKLNLIVLAIIFITSSMVGIFIYQKAKNELYIAGIKDLKKTVDGSIQICATLDQQVKNGKISLEDAQKQAKTLIDGPLDTTNNTRDNKSAPFTYGDNGYIWASLDDATIVMHPLGYEGTSLKDVVTADGRHLMDEFISLAKKPKSNDITNKVLSYPWKNPNDTQFREQVGYVDYFQPWGWTFGIGVFTEDFYGSLPTLKLYIGVGVLIFSIISIIIFTLLSKSSLKLLKNITEVSKKISSGDLHINPIQFKTNDEFGLLANSINIMSENLRNLILQISDIGQNVAFSSEQMSISASDVSNVSEQVAASVSSLANSSMEQAVSTERGNAKVNEMIRDLQDITTQMTQSKNLAEKAKVAVDTGNKSVEMQNIKVNENNMVFQNVSNAVSSLSHKSEEIGNILDVISSIAAETNLLALNAAIEAARAGEQGRGFTVVADEIRHLAEQSSSSVNKISEIIKEVQNGVNNAVSEMGKVQGVVTDMEQAISDTSKAFENISDAVNEIDYSIKNVVKKSEIINGQINEVGNEISNIAKLSQETAAVTEEVAASTEEQTSAIHQIADSSENLAIIANKLQESINKIVS